MTLFSDFVKTAEDISELSGKLEKIDRLASYLYNLESEDLYWSAIWFSGAPFAQKDPRRLNIGKAVIRNALMAVAGIQDKEIYEEEFLQYGEIAKTAEALLKDQLLVESNVSILDIKDFLLGLVEISSSKQKTTSLASFIKKITPREVKWLIRIIVGEFRIGMKEASVEDAIALAFFGESRSLKEKNGKREEELKRYKKKVKWTNMLIGDIGQVALLAKDGKLDEAQMDLHHPIKCMLATAEADIEGIHERMKGSKWAAEDKYDGIRAHIHKQGNEVKIFSRDLNDITEQFPEIAYYAKKVDYDFLFDGEIVVMKDGEIQPFFLLQRRLGRKKLDREVLEEAPCVVIVYDLLYLDGKVLLNTPFRKRRELLESLELPEKGMLLSHLAWVKNKREIENAFNESKARGNEGLVLKDPNSKYMPGKRGINWLKYKQTLEPIDVVVTGVSYGEGRRSKDLSDYTFSIWDRKRKNLVTLGKVYSGVSDDEVNRLTELFKEITIADHGKYREVEPVVVLEIQYESIQKSDRSESGFALRFPRITKIRYGDKDISQIDDVKSVERIYNEFIAKRS